MVGMERLLSFTKSLNPPKTLVIGATGFVGSNFLQTYRSFYPDVIGTSRRPLNGLLELDLKCPRIENWDFSEYTYALVSGAITSIALCEREKEATNLCNVRGTLELVRTLRKKKIIPIIFSSDYVFDGQKGDYSEEDNPNPLNEYGRQKAELEKGIREICEDQFLLIRLSKVYGLTRGDKTLIDEIATRLASKETVRAAYDQTFCPIWIDDVVHAVLKLQDAKANGIFHVCSDRSITRLTLARLIAQEMGADLSLIQGISLDDLNDPFKRPKNTSMKCSKLLDQFNIPITPIEKAIHDYCNRSYISTTKNVKAGAPEHSGPNLR